MQQLGHVDLEVLPAQAPSRQASSRHGTRSGCKKNVVAAAAASTTSAADQSVVAAATATATICTRLVYHRISGRRRCDTAVVPQVHCSSSYNSCAPGTWYAQVINGVGNAVPVLIVIQPSGIIRTWIP